MICLYEMETFMISIAFLSDHELHERTVTIAKEEQRLTLLTIRHLHEVSRRRLFSKRGYSSIFDYAVKALGFSDPAASERVQAMRLLDAVPEVEARIEKGEMTPSSAAAVQRFIRREEKETERQFTPEEKRDLVTQVLGQSVRETQRTLVAMSAEPEAHLLRERERPVSATRTELKLFADKNLMAEIERVRELKGNLKLEEIFSAAVTTYLAKVDPIRKPVRALKAAVASATVSTAMGATSSPHARKLDTPLPQTSELSREASELSKIDPPSPEVRHFLREAEPTPPAPRSRYIAARVRRLVLARSGGRCEYVDAQTGRRCESRHLLQLDHRTPFARGGAATVSNLRQVCPSHNAWAAIEMFGPAKMGRYLRP
jgi:hypothetical protein